MNTNPWLTEQVVAGRMGDVLRRAAAGRLLAVAHPRAGLSRQVGEVLIRAGRRLAGPEALPANRPTRLAVTHDAGGLGAGC